jgi:hypothetical protein
VEGLLGSFPHLVNRAMVETVRSRCSAYVQCVSERGLPQELMSRFTGRPAPVPQRSDLGGGLHRKNRYYPSPEMHRDAATLLEPVCRGFLDGVSSRFGHAVESAAISFASSQPRRSIDR